MRYWFVYATNDLSYKFGQVKPELISGAQIDILLEVIYPTFSAFCYIVDRFNMAICGLYTGQC